MRRLLIAFAASLTIFGAPFSRAAAEPSNAPPQRAVGAAADLTETKPAAAQPNTAVKDLIQEAAAASEADLAAIAAGGGAPRLSDFKNQPLTVLAIVLSTIEPTRLPFGVDTDQWAKQFSVERTMQPGADAAKAPTPANLVKAMQCPGMPRRYSALRSDYVTEVNSKTEGDAANGTVRFRSPGLYSGQVSFAAAKKEGKWHITEFGVPAYRVKTVRGEDGAWRVDRPERLDENLRHVVVTDIPWPQEKVPAADVSLLVARDGTVREVHATETMLNEAAIRTLIKTAASKLVTPRNIVVNISAHEKVTLDNVSRIMRICHQEDATDVGLWVGRRILVPSGANATPIQAGDTLRVVYLHYAKDGESLRIGFVSNVDDGRTFSIQETIPILKNAFQGQSPRLAITFNASVRVRDLAEFYRAMAIQEDEVRKQKPLIGADRFSLASEGQTELERLKPLELKDEDLKPAEIDLEKNLIKGDLNSKIEEPGRGLDDAPKSEDEPPGLK